LCFAGYLLSLIAANLLIQRLNRSVVVLKEKDFLTNDVWRIAVDFDTSPMKRCFRQLGKIYLVPKGKKMEYTSVSELKHIDTAENPGV
jgi:hypothetical protein